MFNKLLYRSGNIMLIVISPAKTLDYTSKQTLPAFTQPALLHESRALMQTCKKLQPQDLAKLMKISSPLAELNYQRFLQWQPDFSLQNARQALLAFKGDVYEGLHVADFTRSDFTFAQQHLRILSGLYGVLRPLDLMMPYRLEMGIKLQHQQYSNLYQFWQDKITDNLNQESKLTTAQHANHALINLASNEYFKAVNINKLKRSVINPIFLDESKEQYKIISFYAKKARGLMARYIIKNQLDKVSDLQSFDLAGYSFDKQRSTVTDWVFKRSAKIAETIKNNQ